MIVFCPCRIVMTGVSLARTKLDYATGSRRWCRKEKTMTAKEAISILEFHNPFLGTDKNLTEAFDMAIKALTAQQWIPCSERLPERSNNVLATISGCVYPDGKSVIRIARYSREQWPGGVRGWIIPNNRLGHVTAWMPLPEPWKGEEK